MVKSTKPTKAVKKPVSKKAPAKPVKPTPEARGLQGILLRHKPGVHRTATGMAVVLSISYILAVYTAFTTSFIPGRIIGLGFLLSFLVTAALVYVLFKQAVRFRVLVTAIVLAVVGVLINLGIFTAGMAANSFISSLEQSTTSYEEYAIVALKASGIKLGTPGQSIGVLATDGNDDVKNAIAEKTPAAISLYPTPTESLLALRNNGAQMALYTTAYMRELEALNNNEVFQELEVLATIRVKISTQKASADVSKPFAVYISGIDTYGAVSKTSRSDVNIIMAVNPKTHRITLVNTPRDYYVQLHGTTGTKDKLTHAGLYGIDTSVKTLENLYGISINYNVRINFTSLEKVVDSIGGVDVNSEYEFSAGGTKFTVGKNRLNGKQALAFSRERYSFEGGDRTRGQNQMKVITAIIDKMSQPSMALKASSILSSLGGAIETNMPTEATNQLIRNQLDTMAKWYVTSTSVDGTGALMPTYSMGARPLYVMVPNENSLEAARRQLQIML